MGPWGEMRRVIAEETRLKRLLLSLALVAAIVPATWIPAQARYSSLVMDADTGHILYAVNPDVQRFPASLAKMMTLYMIFDALDRGKLKSDQRLKVSRTAAGRSPSKLGLKPGQTIKVQEVIEALITKSANDAATVAAEALGRTERRFARMMTARARQLGMRNTTFRNASGLPHYKQRTTARDMAILARALIHDFPNHYDEFSRQTFIFNGRTYRNHNRLMRRYAGMDGLKTGYIRASGFNLAASAKRNGHRIIAIVFGGKSSKWRDHHAALLMNRGFAALNRGTTGTLVAAAPPPEPKPEQVASAVPSTRAAVDSETSTDSDRDWAVQVGAFTHYAPAYLAVKRAAQASKHLADTRITVVPDESENGRVYRARLVGLTESLARTSCLQLQQQNIKCIAVPSDTSLAQGSQ